MVVTQEYEQLGGKPGDSQIYVGLAVEKCLSSNSTQIQLEEVTEGRTLSLSTPQE